jgi:hypothetical protein
LLDGFRLVARRFEGGFDPKGAVEIRAVRLQWP